MRFVRAMAMGTVVAVGAPAWSQQPTPTPSPSPDAAGRFRDVVEVRDELPPVPPSQFVSLKAPAEVQDTPLSVAIVPQALSRSQDARVLTDALRNVAGVNVGSGYGVFDYFNLRGLDSLSGGLVVVDGAPEPESTFYPLYNVRQVEFLKGPAAFLYGANPLLGAVHLVRKQPLRDKHFDASASFGSFGTLDGTVDANRASADGRLALRFNGLYRESDGWRDDKPSQQYAFNPVLAWQPSDQTRVSLFTEYVRSDYAPDSGLPIVAGEIPDVPRTNSYQTPFDTSVQDIWRVRLDAERRVADRFTLRAKVYATDLDWDSSGALIVGAFPFETPAGPTAAIFRALPVLDDRQRVQGGQVEALFDFATGSVKHEALVGFEVSRLDDDFTLDVTGPLPIDLNQPVELSPARPEPILPSQSGDAQATTLAPYVLDRIALGSRVKLSAGARLDNLDYEEQVSATAREESRLSPLLGLSVAATERLSLYVSGATAFAPPSTLVVGPREPEQSRQAELGAKLSFLGGRAFASAAVYQLERDNVAIPDASGVLRQQGDQQARGLELEFSAEPRPGFLVFANYAYTDAELTRFSEAVQSQQGIFVFDHSGNRPAFTPEHLGQFWAVKKLVRGFGLGAGLRYVGQQFIAEDNAFELSSYVLLDARVSWERGPLIASVNFKNLTDQEYFTRGNGGASVIPGQPFGVFARLAYSFGKH